MAGGYEQHLDRFGNCFDQQHEGTEMLKFEFFDEERRWYYTKEVPSCAQCFGLK